MVSGLIALGWDIYKWKVAERVQLKVSAMPGFVMTTGDPRQRYISITATNTGKISTTIKLLTLHGFKNKKDLKKRNGEMASIVTPVYGQLPVRLNPGDDWTAGLLQDLNGIEEYFQYPFVFVGFEDTVSDKPVRAQLDMEKIKNP
jgi:hypothetical protein